MVWDCLIIGGGPAGLTGATYLARFRRKVLVVDAGASRATAIPATHNHPGFARISGVMLLERLREQAHSHGAELWQGSVLSLRKTSTFLADTGAKQISAERVLLATGIEDRHPSLKGLHQAVSKGVVRYCPICDGFEALDRTIAILGNVKEVLRKAIFLRTYSRSITILPLDDVPPTDTLQTLQAAGIEVAPSPVDSIRQTAQGVEVALRSGVRREFNVLYAALGSDVHAKLARELGAACDQIGSLAVDAKQQTTVGGLYAAGDVVSDLHQLSVAEAHAAIAATAIHNSLSPNFR
jgi:thioredoxin reductase (NADPH)